MLTAGMDDACCTDADRIVWASGKCRKVVPGAFFFVAVAIQYER